ncbi:MAG TPA: DNA/RNA non-specific endonuclease [Bacteroidales bacterium]|nr:DNA/RNA non-specific endonuclease [Bacteroidales bacterium]HPI31392.1 DNA/RNA non-specific endonuclease [Bacteroidales bacterium]HQN16774.1 DNA/RNA non-specific endonuclease [Bacteroidales bacterium]HQP16779.1 DNA/RNA non-specific endonuclease [Bacteroidales bacterium]
MAASKNKAWYLYAGIGVIALIFLIFFYGPEKNDEKGFKDNDSSGNNKNIEKKVFTELAPGAGPAGQIIHNKYYTLSYNKQYKQANWVCYKLTSQMLKNKTGRTDDFRPDAEAGAGAATPEDYKNSGYHRGHLCPAGDMKFSAEAMSETFVMTNISPQDADLDGGIWRELEEQVREWAREHKELYITTGPVFGKHVKTIGRNKVAVPEYFFKVILDYKQPGVKGIGFIFKNEACADQLPFLAVSIDSVEAFTGIDFFSALPDADEQKIEKTARWSMW